LSNFSEFLAKISYGGEHFHIYHEHFLKLFIVMALTTKNVGKSQVVNVKSENNNTKITRKYLERGMCFLYIYFKTRLKIKIPVRLLFLFLAGDTNTYSRISNQYFRRHRITGPRQDRYFPSHRISGSRRQVQKCFDGDAQRYHPDGYSFIEKRASGRWRCTCRNTGTSVKARCHNIGG